MIAAGWAVGDAAAKTFASMFYQTFLSGMAFGEAVQLARRETFTQHPEMNTWGAYQCYGDPAYSWIRKDLTASHDLSTDQVALPEALVDLENLTTRQYSGSQRVQVEARLQELSEKAPQDWVESAALQGTLARAYGHLHSYEKAIECCLKALTLHPAEVSLDTVERLVAYRVGLAESLFSSAGDSVSRDEQNKLRANARKEFTSAEESAELLLKVAKTPQRWRALGALHSCRARVETRGDNKRSALKAMSAAYAEEYQLVAGNKQRDVRTEAEALLNQLSAQILLSLIEGPSEALQRDLTANLKKLEILSTAPSIDGSFQKTWIRSAHEILALVAAGRMDSERAGEVFGAPQESGGRCSPR